MNAMLKLLLTFPIGLLVLLVYGQSAWAGQQNTDAVRIDSGPIRGTADGDMRTYLGIPYAAPPVGVLRWRPPQPVTVWKKVRPCTEFGPACPQPKQKEGGTYSEDCLSLNVWTPAKKSGARLPVMVWIHGGGFNFGASSQAEYHGANLARRGVVVVTLNYRLGPLGYLVHPGLDQESPRGTSGNYGLLDQIAALKWVRRNIAAFGGNSRNVTVFGQSAGSRSVSLLLLSPPARGLFHRAIAQSGGPILGSEYLNPAFNGDKASVSKMGEELALRLGCNGPNAVACMRAKTAGEVVAAAACDTGLFAEELFFAPVFDGTVLPRSPLAAFRSGRQQAVPVITGSTANEGALYLTGEKGLDLARYEKFLAARFGAHAQEARAVFPAATDAEVPGAIDRVITVGANVQPARFTAGSAAATGNRAWVFHFTRVPATKLAKAGGAHHGVDLAYVFGNLDEPGAYNDADHALSRTVMDYWVNFAKSGDPNGPGLPTWPAFTDKSDAHMEFGDSVRAGAGLYRNECTFIEKQWERRWRLQ